MNADTKQIVLREQDNNVPMSPNDVKHQVQLIKQMMETVMIEGEHYGTIPGCGDKQVLFKGGAEKLCLTFRMSPSYSTERIDTEINGIMHREYIVTCTMAHIGTGESLGQGQGSCSTLESKYRYRNAGRVCPDCGAEAIIKGKREYGGGWICFNKKGGCGAKFPDNHPVGNQDGGKVDNHDIADQYNTVLKMACKRAMVAACLSVTAASDLFTQDLEDMEFLHQPEPQTQQELPQREQRQSKPATQPNATPSQSPHRCTIQEIEANIKQGERDNGDKWSMSRVFTHDGYKFALFEPDLLADLSQYKQSGQEVYIEFMVQKNGGKITGCYPAESVEISDEQLAF